ncbi:26s proteasome non-atpase regulatory subunit 5-related [Anaeramoeba ignava]|uniref:26s proteasome non-atpase regulatory subunit 5-related n=1 Tax=Anaeramoeba ignava TaxID=1746090 RepID=A0A9Q0L6Z9_ANAIG|nr:26s proteasome non-atpase regulatory subunit 5-related [Anaeramoeba ignava]
MNLDNLSLQIKNANSEKLNQIIKYLINSSLNSEKFIETQKKIPFANLIEKLNEKKIDENVLKNFSQLIEQFIISIEEIFQFILTKENSRIIIKSLQSVNPELVLIILKLLEKIIKNLNENLIEDLIEENSNEMKIENSDENLIENQFIQFCTQNNDLFLVLLQLITNESSKFIKISENILVSITTKIKNCFELIWNEKSIFQKELNNTFNSQKTSSTILLRIYSLIFKMYLESPSKIFQDKINQNTNIIKRIQQEIQGVDSDILRQLSIIEILHENIPSIQVSIEDKNPQEISSIFSTILKTLIDSIENGGNFMNKMLIDSILKFLGGFFQNGKGSNLIQFESFQLFLNKILQKEQEEQEQEYTRFIINFISDISSNCKGLEWILSNFTQGILFILSEFANFHNKVEILIYANSSLGKIFEFLYKSNSDTKELENENENENQNENLLPYKLFQVMKRNCNLIYILKTHCESSNIEIRKSALYFLNSFIHFDFGIIEFFQTKDFLDLIMDKTEDKMKESLEWKFSVLVTISTHPKTKELIGDEKYYKLQKELSTGPFQQYQKVISQTLIATKKI